MGKNIIQEQVFGVLLLKRINSKSYADLGSWPSFFRSVTRCKDVVDEENEEGIEKADNTLYDYRKLKYPIPDELIEEFEDNTNRFENIRNLNSIFSDTYHGKVIMEIDQIPNEIELTELVTYSANQLSGVSREGKERRLFDADYRLQVYDVYKEIGRKYYNKMKLFENTIYFWFELIYLCISGNLKGHKVPFLHEFDKNNVVTDKPSFADVNEFVDFATKYGLNSSIGKRELNAIWENRSLYYNNPLLLKEAADLNYFSDEYDGFLLSFELYERALYHGNINAAFHCFWNILYMGDVTKAEFEQMLKEEGRKKGSYRRIERSWKKEEPETYFERMKIAISYLTYGAMKNDGICYNSLGNCVLDIIKTRKSLSFISDKAENYIQECHNKIKKCIPGFESDSLDDLKFQLYEKGVELDNPNSYVNSCYMIIERLRGKFDLYNKILDEKEKEKLKSDIKFDINRVSERLDVAVTKHKLPEAAHTIARFLQGKEKTVSENECIYGNNGTDDSLSYKDYLSFFKKSYFFQKAPGEKDMLKLASKYAYLGGLSTFSATQKQKCIDEYKVLTDRLKELEGN